MSVYTRAHTETQVHDEAHDHELPYATQLKANRLGLWLFFISEFFLFGALLITRFYLWNVPGQGQTRPELSQELGLLTSSILLLSSYFVYRGETAITYGDRKSFTRSYLIAALLGLLFFVGVVVMEWNLFGLRLELFGFEWFGHLKPTDGVYGGVFYMMTGMHALHVISGVALLLAAWNRGRQGDFSAERHWGVEAIALYWHYVDVIWIFFYPALYLIGKPV
ncbi:MAG: heme-copper oxidase subunit III [Anaerolineales bacterium]|nr:heme-copper oxidase subunit III [Anaerolineales bacterium]MCB8988787.1 heme-copper oxidase subunit III [Ardenticatenaceae bacterium]